MLINHVCKTLFFTAACAALLLPGGMPSRAQAADSIDYLYVSPQGDDAWSGRFPVPTDGSGPFQTLGHAQEMVQDLAAPGLSRPLEMTVDAGVCPPQESLSRWFGSAPSQPVIWHAEPSRTVLIYTRTLAEQIDALSAEDAAAASPVTRFYVSPAGDDAWSGRLPAPDAGSGPFRTLDRAEEAVGTFESNSPEAVVEVVFEDAAPTSSVKPTEILVQGAEKSSGKSSGKTFKSPKYAATGLAALKASKASAAGLTAHTLSAYGVLGSHTAQPPKFVFAHYMVANRDYGPSVASYERDIQDAQAAGVDGFALNIGWWSGANYKQDTATMFQAAHALGTGFKLFFSVDEGGKDLTTQGVPASDILNMMQTYGSDPNYFHYLNRPVLSTWGGDGPAPSVVQSFWLGQVLTPLRASGCNVYFVPQFGSGAPNSAFNVTASAPQIQSTYQSWWTAHTQSLSFADGLFEVSALPPLSYAYSRTVTAAPLAAGQRGGLTLRDQHWECFYDPTHEFCADDAGRTITIPESANFHGGTFLIKSVQGGYPITDYNGVSLGRHSMIVLSLPAGVPSPAKHLDATGSSYTVQSATSIPQEGSSLLAEEAFAQTAHANGKLFVSSVSPQYWQSLTPSSGRYYAEFCGGEGLAAQWNSIMTVQKPEWVELFTWNDFGENTYFSPIDDVAKYWPYAFPGSSNNVVGYMKSHAGFTALNKYFINWYKSGVQPAVTGDKVYYFYRTQPKNMTATNDPLGSVTNQGGPVADTIYITAMLPSAATLKVGTGSATKTYSLPAGTSTLEVPFSPGPQSFTLLRNGQTVLTQQGAPIVTSAETYNFGLYSGVLSK